jgi:hypothetical protein
VAQGFGGEVGERGVAVDGHDEVSFREDGAQDVDDAVSAAECEAVGVRAPLPSLIMAPSAQARPPYAGQHWIRTSADHQLPGTAALSPKS